MNEAMKAREAIHATSLVKPEYAREFRNEAIAAVDAMEAEVARLREERDKLARFLALDCVQEWAVCEIPKLMWKPGKLYRFIVVEGCEACAEYVRLLNEKES